MHTTTFAVFAAASLSSPFLARKYDNFFSSPLYLISVAIVFVMTMVSWKVFGGCPFTVWENRLHEKKQTGNSYVGSCLPYYVERWFGLKISNKVFTGLLVALLILPIIAGII